MRDSKRHQPEKLKVKGACARGKQSSKTEESHYCNDRLKVIKKVHLHNLAEVF